MFPKFFLHVQIGALEKKGLLYLSSFHVVIVSIYFCEKGFHTRGLGFFLVGVWVVWRQYAWMGKRDRKKMAIDWVLVFFVGVLVV